MEEQEIDLMKDNDTKSKDEDDPFLQLGFGICAYFNLLRMFIMLFFFLTLLALPILFVYNSKSGLSGLRNYERS
jgi:hypothetical protein